MPELAEVEYYRKQWDSGLGKRVKAVMIHADKRIFRGTDTRRLQEQLVGAKLVESQAQAKQMLFRFTKGVWVGIHLGMTGKLSVSRNLASAPGKHEHLVIEQAKQRLVFSDPRQFGRVRYHESNTAPDWWQSLPPAVISPEFTLDRMSGFLARHARLPIKGALLLQEGFPGIGNWMADEILWRAGIDPRKPAGKVKQLEKLWTECRFVCEQALEKVGSDFSDPPADWLFHERWSSKGKCPIHKRPLVRATIAGRTTSWCKLCQPKR